MRPSAAHHLFTFRSRAQAPGASSTREADRTCILDDRSAREQRLELATRQGLSLEQHS
jgi:hypothetical protein